MLEKKNTYPFIFDSEFAADTYYSACGQAWSIDEADEDIPCCQFHRSAHGFQFLTH